MKFLAMVLAVPVALLALMLALVVVEPPQATAGDEWCRVDADKLEAVPGGLDKEQLRNAATIVQVGRTRKIPPGGLVVAIAAAMQESTLRNLPGGDRDSAGLFQMRPSAGWGSWGQVTDPVYAATAFFGGADVPPANPGLLDIEGWQQMSVTEAAQAVERSAYPDAYAKWVDDATKLVGQLTDEGIDCRSSAAVKCPPSQLSVEDGLMPDARLVVRCAVARFHIQTIGGLAQSGHISGSDHYTGRAVDLMIDGWRTSAGIAFGDRVAAYFLAHHKSFGITYIIWRNRIWSVQNPSWRSYSHPDGRRDPTAMHMDHLHLSVAGNAAHPRRETHHEHHPHGHGRP